MNLLQWYIDLTVPVKLRTSPFEYRKAKILSFIHLFLFIVSIIVSLATLLFLPVNDMPIFLGNIIVIVLIWAFKRWGNLLVSGNLMAFGWSMAFVPIIPESGGLLSDNLLWLIVAPLLAMLIAGKRSGFVWFILLLSFVVYLFVDTPDPNLKLNNALGYDASYYLVSYSLLFGTIFGVVMIFETGQGLIIKMLNEQKGLLEFQKNEITQHAAELTKIEEKLRISNADLEQFAYSASHDLKEPLRMIGMYAQLMQKKMTQNQDNSLGTYLNFVLDGVGRMQKLLDDLLNYSRMGRREEAVKEIDLNDILFIVIHNLTASLNETQAEIIASRLPIIRGSMTEMVQLFQNLISNSIKFRKQEGTPTIKVLMDAKEKDVELSFIDNGIGIPDKFKNKVFKLFERLHTDRAVEGSGIGLATCKKIVEKYGGEIWVESEEGEGTTFHIRFPKTDVVAI